MKKILFYACVFIWLSVQMSLAVELMSPATITVTELYSGSGDGSGTTCTSEFSPNMYSEVKNTSNGVSKYTFKDKDKATFSNGNTIRVWYESGDIYGEITNIEGDIVKNAFIINMYATSMQKNASVAVQNNNIAVVLFSSSQDNDSSYSIYGQAINSSGDKVDGEFKISTYYIGSQDLSNIIATKDGGTAVIWESSDQDGSGKGIYMQFLNSDRTPKGIETRVNSCTSGDKHSFFALGLPNNGHTIVAWESNDQDGDGAGIYFQEFNELGEKFGDEYQANQITAGDQTNPKIALSSQELISNNFIIFYNNYSQLFGNHTFVSKVRNLRLKID